MIPKKLQKTNIWILLTAVILIGCILRLWQLGSVPPSPDWDEVALGYNAYSLLHTAKDEYGKFLPVVLRSFDDYKPALYAYLCIPTVEIFGLSVFAVRLPSAIFGLVTIIAVFFLIKELFKREDIAIVSAFLLAISPWHIQFSRLGFETNVGLAFNIFAGLFFVKGLKKPWLLSLTAFFSACAIYTYQSEKVFTPLFIILLVVIYHHQLWKVSKRFLLLSIVIGLLAILPMLIYIIQDRQALLRVQGTSIFNSPTVYLKDNPQRIITDHLRYDYIGLVLDNRRLIYAREVIGGYLSHYNLNWLLNGDIQRHHAPDMGLVYLLEVPFIFIGIYQLIFGQFEKKAKLLIFGWFLLAPVPASVTTGVPHAVRTMNFLPTWQVFSAIGFLYTYGLISLYKQRFFQQVIYIVFSILAIGNLAYYLDQYFVQQNYFHALEWQYGYEQLVPYIDARKGQYKTVIISETGQMEKSYMFFLFYLKYSPDIYQRIGEHASGGFAADHHFDKYSFRRINWTIDKESKDVLYVGTPDEFPKGVNALRKIFFPDGSEDIEIVRT